MAQSEAVQGFVRQIGATKGYPGVRFRGNLFDWRGIPLIVKGDDSGADFWGVPEKAIGELNANKTDFYIVLLSNWCSAGCLTENHFAPT